MIKQNIYNRYINNIYFFKSINKKITLFNFYISFFNKSIHFFSKLIFFFFEYYFFFNFLFKCERIYSIIINSFFIYQLNTSNLSYLFLKKNGNINYISWINIYFNIIYNFLINKLLKNNYSFIYYNHFFFNNTHYNKQFFFFFFYPNIYFMLKKFQIDID